jgi:hypothetical protein
MYSLIPALMLMTTAISPNVTYQVVTDEFHQHNTYLFHGNIIVDAPDRSVFLLDLEACETKERLVFHNIIDEVILFNNRSPRKNFFTLQKDYDRCLLVVRKNTHRNNMYYNRDYDYWYPNYNHIQIVPKRIIKRRYTKSARNHYNNSLQKYNNIIIKPKHKPKVYVKTSIKQKQLIAHKKNIIKFHKKNKKHKKGHVKIKKYNKMYY